MRIAKIACLCLLGALLAPAQTVNCVVAVVNGRLITLVDVQVVAEFGLVPAPPEGAEDDPRLAALEALIDRMVVLDMTRQQGSVGGDEAEKVLGEARQRLGEGEFTRRLRNFGLREEDLRIYIEEGLLFETALELRFSRHLPVSRTEVEKHYREIYAPEQGRRGLRPEPLEKVTEILEARIRDRDLKRQKEAWIKDLRSRADIRVNKDCLK